MINYRNRNAIQIENETLRVTVLEEGAPYPKGKRRIDALRQMILQGVADQLITRQALVELVVTFDASDQHRVFRPRQFVVNQRRELFI